jgi:hypothetical protein
MPGARQKFSDGVQRPWKQRLPCPQQTVLSLQAPISLTQVAMQTGAEASRCPKGGLLESRPENGGEEVSAMVASAIAPVPLVASKEAVVTDPPSPRSTSKLTTCAPHAAHARATATLQDQRIEGRMLNPPPERGVRRRRRPRRSAGKEVAACS